MEKVERLSGSLPRAVLYRSTYPSWILFSGLERPEIDLSSKSAASHSKSFYEFSNLNPKNISGFATVDNTMFEKMKALLIVVVAVLLLGSAIQAQTVQKLSIPPESPRWLLTGQARVTECQGRKCIYLNGGGAGVKDFEMRDGVIDVDVTTPASRGFFGIQFRVSDDNNNGEWVYLRQHKSGYPDALQYTPVLNTGLNWQLYNGPALVRSIFRKTLGFTCVWKWPGRRQNSSLKTWRNRRW